MPRHHFRPRPLQSHNYHRTIKSIPPRPKGEHLIFIKHVPQYMSRHTIPALFTPYHPTNIKNVYPHSSDTTLVIAFSSDDEAEAAQLATNGLRVEHVILRVEAFEKRRSVQFLRGQGRRRRDGGQMGLGMRGGEDWDVDEDKEENIEYWENDDEEEGGMVMDPLSAGSVDFPPLPGVVVKGSNGGDVLAKGKENDGAKEWVVTTTAAKMEDGSTSKTKDDVRLIGTFVVPNVHAQKEDSLSGDTVVEEGHETLYKEALNDGRRRHKKEKGDHSQEHGKASSRQVSAERESIFAPWELTDTAARIHQNHVRNCAFCRPRNRSIA